MNSEQVRPKLIDIEAVLNSKNPNILKWTPKFLINYVKRIIHQEEINAFLIKHGHLIGTDFTNAIITEFNITYQIVGLEKIPKDKRYIFAANHPLGGLDGIILMNALGREFDQIKFPVNDILMNIDNLKPLFLPINKHGSQTQKAANLLENAYKSDTQILMFPAGLVSRKIDGKIADLEWKKSFVKKAIEHHRDIIPVHIDGQNSKFFYNLANWRKRLGIKVNIEMIFLADELFKQKGANITLRFGEPIPYKQLKNNLSPQKWANDIKLLVYNMAEK